jgi:hypothetical protein
MKFMFKLSHTWLLLFCLLMHAWLGQGLVMARRHASGR